jgi:hypothetical protein
VAERKGAMEGLVMKVILQSIPFFAGIENEQ